MVSGNMCMPSTCYSPTNVTNTSTTLTTEKIVWNCSSNETTMMPIGHEVVVYETSVLMKAVMVVNVGSVGLLLNVLVLATVATYRPMRHQFTTAFIANLAVIDAAISVCLILTVFNEYPWTLMRSGSWRYELLCRAWYGEPILWSLVTSSAYGTVALSFDAYVSIVHRVWHRTAYTWKKVTGIVALAWIIGFGYTGTRLIVTSDITAQCICTSLDLPGEMMKKLIGIISFAVDFVVPSGVLLYFYGHMLRVMSRDMQTDSEDRPMIQTREGLQRARLDTIQTLAAVSIFYVLCWLFGQVYYLLYYFDVYINYAGDVYNATVVIICFNSCVNPIIYGIRYRQFQKGLRWLFCQNCHQCLHQHINSELLINEQTST